MYLWRPLRSSFTEYIESYLPCCSNSVRFLLCTRHTHSLIYIPIFGLSWLDVFCYHGSQSKPSTAPPIPHNGSFEKQRTASRHIPPVAINIKSSSARRSINTDRITVKHNNTFQLRHRCYRRDNLWRHSIDVNEHCQFSDHTLLFFDNSHESSLTDLAEHRGH